MDHRMRIYRHVGMYASQVLRTMDDEGEVARLRHIRTMRLIAKPRSEPHGHGRHQRRLSRGGNGRRRHYLYLRELMRMRRCGVVCCWQSLGRLQRLRCEYAGSVGDA